MIQFSDNAEVNTQINHIFKLNEKGKSDQEIATFFTNNAELNLKTKTGKWTPEDIKAIRDNFQTKYNFSTAKKSMKSGPRAASIAAKQASQDQVIREVKIINIDMPFISMVEFMIKLALAAIPAAIIFFIIIFGFMAISGMFGISR